jgi:hypothetical protein
VPVPTINQVVSAIKASPRVQYHHILRVVGRDLSHVAPEKEITTNALVYHDSDLQAAQYWDSCGTAATIVQLRHLNPKRSPRLARFKASHMPIDSQDKVDEISPNILGHFRDFLSDGAAGRPKIDQAWLYAESFNSIGKLERILCGPKSKLRLRPIKYPRSINELEEYLMEVFANNHIAYLSIDGAFRPGEDYQFPKEKIEWKKRCTTKPIRKPKPPCQHWVIDILEKLVEEQCSQSEFQGREGYRPKNNDYSKCNKLRHALDIFKDTVECPTHAVTVTGVYEHNSKKYPNTLRLYRILDSNPGPDYTETVNLANRYPQGKKKKRQGKVFYMTAIELWEHTMLMKQPRIIEWALSDSGPCNGNKIQPFTMENGKVVYDLFD